MCKPDHDTGRNVKFPNNKGIYGGVGGLTSVGMVAGKAWGVGLLWKEQGITQGSVTEQLQEGRSTRRKATQHMCVCGVSSWLWGGKVNQLESERPTAQPATPAPSPSPNLPPNPPPNQSKSNQGM